MLPITGRGVSRRAPRQQRAKRQAKQIPLWEAGQSAGQPDLWPTRVLLSHRSCPRVLELIRQVRTFFPELDGIQLKIGLTRRAAGLAAREQPWIWVNPRKLTRHTIAHEIVHLLQFRGLAPAGEKSADLYAMARHSYLVDDLPYYLKTPRSLRLACLTAAPTIHRLLHQVARDSLARRDEGERTYLRWFEQELESRWLAQGEVTTTPNVPVQTSLF